MTDRPQDAELHARFAAQRRVDAGQAPEFATLLERARAEAPAAPASAPLTLKRRRWAYAGGLAAAAIIAALLAIPRTRSTEAAFEAAVRAYQNGPALGAWQSPTDALLDVPGSQLISTVPGLGRP
jgi:hypothetical protein